MMRNIWVELKIHFKRPLILILLACSTLLFSFFVYDQYQQEKNIHQKYLMESNYHVQGIQLAGDLYEMMEGYKPSIYKEAESVVFRTYLNRKENLHTKESYEYEILYNQIMIELMEKYDYKTSFYTIEEYKRKIEEYTYLIEHNQTKQLDETMTSIHSFVEYNKQYFFILVMLISMIIGSFSISEDIEMGSLKTRIVQPISRSKYMLSKMISVYLTNVIVLFGPILLIVLGLVFMKGVGDFCYPFVVFQKGSYLIVDEGMVMLICLVFNLILSLFVSMISFLCSYFMKDSISAFLMALFVFLCPYFVVNIASIGNSLSHWIYSTYYHLIPVINGDLLIQTGNMHVNLLLGSILLIVLSIVSGMVVVLNFRHKDLEI